MDNSFGTRPPWPNQSSSMQPSYPSSGQMRPGLAAGDGSIASQFVAPSVGGYLPPSAAPVMSTPSSTAGYPLGGLDISSQMFMQAMNFERMMLASNGQQPGMGVNGQQTRMGGIINGQQPGMGDMSFRDNTMNSMMNRTANDTQRADTSLDLIEQRQAMEQTRLLERFKQMRLWQQQQQEMLMNQQQQQLMQLKKEQDRVQGYISRQRDQQWGGGRQNTYGEMSTPPHRQIAPGTDLSQLLAGTSQGKGLPKPVMYVHPKEDEDEIKTNPDLFSDTNSNRGSQAGVEDGMFPIPDSASEASVDVGDIHIRQQLKQNQQHFQQRFNPHELDAPKKLHRSFAELETSEDFINQSYQSPTVFEKHEEKLVYKDEKAMSEIAENEESDYTDDDDDDEVEDDEDEDNSEDEDETGSEEESQDNTQIEVKKGSSSLDELPIKPGVDGTKTFEQLLEEQLQAEEDRLRQEAANKQSTVKPKKTFLKKGTGIARFDGKPGQRPPRSKKSHKSATGSQKTSHQYGSTSSAANAGQKSNTAAGSGVSQKTGKSTGKPPVNQKSKGGQKTGGHTAGGNKTRKDGKGKNTENKSPAKVRDNHTTGTSKNKRTDSIPDSASLNEKQMESEAAMELDEFEILEQFADNMSFCSNSSIVTKGLKGLQGDRILAGRLPTQSTKVGFVSPRSALIRKLEAEKEDRLKKMGMFKSDSGVQKSAFTDTSKPAKHVTKEISAVTNSNKNNNGNNEVDDDNDDDDYESVSDSSEDTSDDSDVDSSDNKTNKVTSSVQANLKDPGNSRDLHKLAVLSNFHDSLQDASVLSTEKKLERALSYTGMTETSESKESDSDRGIDSSEDSDSEEDSESEIQSAMDDLEKKSPSKILTRKVAVKMGANAMSFPTLADSTDFSNSFNSSAFAPKLKSPIVISKEKVSVKDMEFRPPKIYQTVEETKFSYHSDTDSIGNSKKDLSDVEEESDKRAATGGVREKKTLQFDDDDEWDDYGPQVNKQRLDSEGDHDKTLSEDVETQMAKLDFNKVLSSDKTEGDTPPTSKLVAKLFPKLKPQQKKQEEQDLQKVQSVSQADVGDGAQSKVLRDKLLELEREIEKFRSENSHLAKLRTDREEGLTMLKKEIMAFEKEKNEELKRLENFKNEEMKKLKHERKVFEKYQKAARAGPDKKEREEIENLKIQASELQDEMKKKESRWTSNNARLRAKIDHLEQENEELKEEIKLMEKKRLEWMQKDKGKGKSAGQIRSSTPTEEELDDLLTNGHIQHLQSQLNDLSVASSIKPNIVLKPSQSQPKINVHSSLPPGSRLGTSHSSLGNHTTQQNKINNVNQSNKSSNVTNVKSNNQSKKAPAQKTGLPSQAQGQNKVGAKSSGKFNHIPGKGAGDKNVLRNSLNEDLPRTATFAQPHDVSMYSEADGEMSVHMATNLPRKLGSKMGVDRSVIDKGNDNSYEETQHSDGKVERSFRNGAREILFSNGTRKEISADGQSIIVSFFNGDMKQIMPDQRVVYYYAEAQTTVTSYTDGLEILQFPNNQTEKLYADGTREITFPDQTVKYIFPNGSEESIFQDGTIIRLEKNGDKIMEFPNGQREIHTQDYKKREYPDGTAKTVYPDGRQETRYSNGRLRVKDKDGNVIIDRLC